MPFIFNGTTIKSINFNGTTVKTVIYNGETVFTADNEIFKDGVLADGVTLNNFSVSGLNLGISYYRSPQSSGSITGNITFDFTDFSTITIKGTTSGGGGFADCSIKLGIDSASDTLRSEGGGYHWSEQSFEKTYDISALTGDHSITGYISINNRTSEPTWGADGFLNLTEIVAYA